MGKKNFTSKDTKQAYDQGKAAAYSGRDKNPHTPTIAGAMADIFTFGAFSDKNSDVKARAWGEGHKDGMAERKGDEK